MESGLYDSLHPSTLGLALDFQSVSLLLHIPLILTHGFPVLVASGLDILLKEFRMDGDYMRFILLVTFPFLVCVALVRLKTFSSRLICSPPS